MHEFSLKNVETIMNKIKLNFICLRLVIAT